MTVFVGRDTLIVVQGTGIEAGEDVWDRVLAFKIPSHAGRQRRVRAASRTVIVDIGLDLEERWDEKRRI